MQIQVSNGNSGKNATIENPRKFIKSLKGRHFVKESEPKIQIQFDGFLEMKEFMDLCGRE